MDVIVLRGTTNQKKDREKATYLSLWLVVFLGVKSPVCLHGGTFDPIK